MIRVTVELLSARTGKTELLGVARISNVGGTPTSGSYSAELTKRGSQTTAWRRGHVQGFPRKRLGGWDLLYRVLHELVGDRNGPDQLSLPEQGAAYWKGRAMDAEGKLGTLRRAIRLAMSTGQLEALVEQVTEIGGLPRKKAEPVACWKRGCYLAVDDEGRCPTHGKDDLRACTACGAREEDTPEKTLFGGLCGKCDAKEEADGFDGAEGC